MEDPVSIPCAARHTFCRQCITQAFETHSTCPNCRQSLLPEIPYVPDDPDPSDYDGDEPMADAWTDEGSLDVEDILDRWGWSSEEWSEENCEWVGTIDDLIIEPNGLGRERYGLNHTADERRQLVNQAFTAAGFDELEWSDDLPHGLEDVQERLRSGRYGSRGTEGQRLPHPPTIQGPWPRLRNHQLR